MDRFFSTVAALMSLLMRSLVEATLQDLIVFLAQYMDGNNYQGVYDFFSGLALPVKQLPFVFYFLPFERGGGDLDQQPISATDPIQISPSLDHTMRQLCYVIDLVVNCLNIRDEFPRVECFLFQSFNRRQELRYFNLVSIDEQIVVAHKQQVREIIEANSFGPEL